jgi:hypothetical protein
VEAELVVLVEELADDDEELEEVSAEELVALLEEEDDVVLGAGGRIVGMTPASAVAGIVPPGSAQVNAHALQPAAASAETSARRDQPRNLLVSLSSPQRRFIASEHWSWSHRRPTIVGDPAATPRNASQAEPSKAPVRVDAPITVRASGARREAQGCEHWA